MIDKTAFDCCFQLWYHSAIYNPGAHLIVLPIPHLPTSLFLFYLWILFLKLFKSPNEVGRFMVLVPFFFFLLLFFFFFFFHFFFLSPLFCLDNHWMDFSEFFFDVVDLNVKLRNTVSFKVFYSWRNLPGGSCYGKKPIR